MKKYFLKMMVATVGVAAFLTSCSKDDAANPASKVCLVSSIGAAGDTLRESFEYSSDNKLVVNQYYKDKDTKIEKYVYSYVGNTVTKEQVDPSQPNEKAFTTYTLGDNGFAESSVIKSEGGGWATIDSTFYTYDNAGYLIKEDTKEYYKGMTNTDFVLSNKRTTNYTISKGNTVKEVSVSGSSTITSTSEFTDNLNSTNLFSPASLTGKANKNLVKKTTGSSYSYTYDYEFDNSNNPVKATITGVYDNRTTKNTILLNYSCK